MASVAHSASPPRAEAEKIDTVVWMETPENVVFAHPVAGPARRALAHAIDWIVIGFVMALLGLIVGLVSLGGMFLGHGELLSHVSQGLMLIAIFFVQWVYFAALEATTSTTPGKRLLGLRVVTTTGRPIAARDAILRNLLRVADLLPGWYLLGAVVMTLSPRFQRIGDWAAGTLVVAHVQVLDARPVVIFPPITPDEIAWFPSTARLTAAERDAVELMLRRGPALGMARYDELARMLAAPIGARLQLSLAAPIRQLAVLYERSVAAGRPSAIAVTSRGGA